MPVMFFGKLKKRKSVWRLLPQALSVPQDHIVDLAKGREPKLVLP